MELPLPIYQALDSGSIENNYPIYKNLFEELRRNLYLNMVKYYSMNIFK
jgi:hypothetical protein